MKEDSCGWWPAGTTAGLRARPAPVTSGQAVVILVIVVVDPSVGTGGSGG